MRRTSPTGAPAAGTPAPTTPGDLLHAAAPGSTPHAAAGAARSAAGHVNKEGLPPPPPPLSRLWGPDPSCWGGPDSPSQRSLRYVFTGAAVQQDRQSPDPRAHPNAEAPRREGGAEGSVAPQDSGTQRLNQAAGGAQAVGTLREWLEGLGYQPLGERQEHWASHGRTVSCGVHQARPHWQCGLPEHMIMLSPLTHNQLPLLSLYNLLAASSSRLPLPPVWTQVPAAVVPDHLQPCSRLPPARVGAGALVRRRVKLHA